MNGGTNQQTVRRSKGDGERRSRGNEQRPSFVRYLRSGLSSGLFAGVAGLVTIGRVRRTLREGSEERATKQGMLAVFWIGVAMTQWGVNRSDNRARQEMDQGTVESLDSA